MQNPLAKFVGAIPLYAVLVVSVYAITVGLLAALQDL
jgi:hypothetical protein